MNAAKQYGVYICTGSGKNRRESGCYTKQANSYVAAAGTFAKDWNTNSVSTKYGSDWKPAGKRKDMPKFHLYLKDEKGNKLLLILSK